MSFRSSPIHFDGARLAAASSPWALENGVMTHTPRTQATG